MPRRAREESPTGLYHVMMRGVNREKIFRLDKHKSLLIEIIKDEIKEFHVEIYAYCIMNNHVHIIIKSELVALSKLFKKINIKYAMRYNKNFDRVGHVFQGRFKSEVILSDVHLLQCIRYVHRNPVKAGMVLNIESYKWSSYNEYFFQPSTLISEETKSLVLDLAGGDNEFKKFHLRKEINLFLDTDEEIETNKQELANSIIKDYCKDNGIIELSKIKNNKEVLESIIIKLLDYEKFTYREIARLLKVNRSYVQKINEDNKTFVDKVKV